MSLSSFLKNCIIFLILNDLTHLVILKRESDLVSSPENDIVYLYPNTENSTGLDVTTIYKIINIPMKWDEKGGFKDDQFGLLYDEMFSIEIHSRTNAIGIPIDMKQTNFTSNINQNIPVFIDDNNNSFQSDNNMKINYDYSWEQGYKNRKGDFCDINYNTRRNRLTESDIDDCLNSLNYYRDLPLSGESNILTMEWTPQTPRNYLAISYILGQLTNLDFKITIFEETNRKLHTSKLFPTVVAKTLVIQSNKFNNKEKYKIIFSRKCSSHCGYDNYDKIFEIRQISYHSLNLTEDEDLKIVTGNTKNAIQNRPVPFYTTNYIGATDVNRKLEIQYDCLNGGFKRKSTTVCVCPPGFSGTKCETGCGPNFYGADCSGVCSLNIDGCRGMYMCKMDYGCTCPPGLTGPWCDEDCPIHQYGADCDQLCLPNCFNSTCDQYSGICSQGCSSGYVPPNCDKKYYYYDNPPKFVSAEVESITIQLNSVNDLNGYYTNMNYFQLLYKASNETDFTRSELMSYLNRTSVTIHDLEPDTTYIIGVLLVMDDGYSSENDIVYGQYKTLCRIPLINDYNIKLSSGHESINISWNKVNTSRYECRITKYNISLMLNNTRNKKKGSLNFISSPDDSYTIIEDLWPGYEYSLTMTPWTSMGPLPISPIYKAVPLITDDEISIKQIEVKTKNENGSINISWAIVNNIQKDSLIVYPATCILRYKIKKLLSCSSNEMERNWTSITLYNRTSYEILDVTPNAQYIIQVLLASKDPDYIYHENLVYALTPASIPETEPTLDLEHQPFITNSSVYVQWKIDPSSCIHLNGIFLKFFVELKDTIDSDLQIKETITPFITFTDLKPSTAYDLKVFLKTNVGYNSERFLFFNFTTKSGNLVPVKNLTVYKKSLKNRMVGLRWSYPENSKSDGFLISFNEDFSTTSKNITHILPKKCSAWPQSYCHTFYNVVPSNNYTVIMKAKSIDYPEGGEASTVIYDNVDGLPDSPNNFKATEIRSTNITLQWDIPGMFNGVLKAFVINAEEVSSADIETCCVSITPVEIVMEEEKPTYNYTLLGLKSGSTYSIGVMSKSLWYSSLSRIQVTTLPKT